MPMLHYEVHGAGRPVVLIHGFCVTFAANFVMPGWVERLVAGGHQVIGLDLRGHGKSFKPREPEAYGTRNMADDVLAVVDHLGLEKPALVGYSLGSLFALDLAQRHPGRWSRIALCATGDVLLGGIDVVKNELVAALERESFPNDLPVHISNYWTFATKVSGDRQALLAAARASYPPFAGSIDLPTLIVSGGRDVVLGRGTALSKTIPNARYVEIPDADHFSLALDPRAIAEIVQG